MEIEDLLGRLSDVNDSLSSCLSGTGDPRSHTLARHRDILHDYTQVPSQHQRFLTLMKLSFGHTLASLATNEQSTLQPGSLASCCIRCLSCWDQCATQEFRRLQAALGAARDRAELFAGASETSPLQVDACSRCRGIPAFFALHVAALSMKKGARLGC
jgi:hypothetical protein